MKAQYDTQPLGMKGGIDMVNLIFWGVIFVATVIAEVMSMQLVSIWFAFGAAGAFCGALAEWSFTAQLGIFVLISALLLLITRPILKKLRVRLVPPMNAEKGIGETALVIEDIDPALGTGRARQGGIDWMAVSETGCIIPKDSIVVISKIDGAKLIVRPDNVI